MSSQNVKKIQMKVMRKKNEDKQNREIIILKKKIEDLKNIDPHEITKFNQLPLSESTRRGLKKCNYLEPTLVQKLSLPQILMGNDVVVDSKTGTGKTLCFVIPILELLYMDKWDSKSGLAVIILNPTGELAYQSHEIIKIVSKYHNLTSAAVIGGKDLLEEKKFIQSINIVACTPGRLLQHLDESQNFNTSNLKMLIIDEADQCLADDFADQVNAILEALPGSRQTLLFSATQTRNIQDLIRSGLTKPIFISTHEHTSVSTPVLLKQSYIICEAHKKLSLLYSFLKSQKKKKILVFIATSKQVKFMSQVLSWLNIGSLILSMHADMKCSRRIENFNSFLGKQKAIMLATDVAARGLDFADVHWVVQFDCPEDIKVYKHRVGRTARYFRRGDAVLFLTESECDVMVDRLEQNKMTVDQITVGGSKLECVDSRLEDLLLHEVAQRQVAVAAYTAYLKNIGCMEDKELFRVGEVDRTALARSYGLLTLSSTTTTNNNTTNDNTVVGARKSRLDELLVPVTAPLPLLDASHAGDTSKYLRDLTPKYAPPQEAISEDSITAIKKSKSWLSFSAMKKIWQKNKEKDSEVHKNKVKTRKADLLAKRKELRHPNRRVKDSGGNASVGAGDDSDDSDEVHQRIIDELPDIPDDNESDDCRVTIKRKMVKRPLDDSSQIHNNTKTSNKKRRQDSPSSSSSSLEDESVDSTQLNQLSLQQQEQLALQLLAGR